MEVGEIGVDVCLENGSGVPDPQAESSAVPASPNPAFNTFLREIGVCSVSFTAGDYIT